MLQGLCGKAHGLPQGAELSFKHGSRRYTVQDIIGAELYFVIQVEITSAEVYLGQIEVFGSVLFVSRLVNIGLFRPEAVAFLCQLPPSSAEVKIPGNDRWTIYTIDKKE